MAKAKQKDQCDATGSRAIDLDPLHKHVQTQAHDGVLSTARNAQGFSPDPAPFPSPVHSIQDRLERVFGAKIHEDDGAIRDLRPIGFGVAVVFSLIAWTLIIQLARLVF
jgi:hypothetical protein